MIYKVMAIAGGILWVIMTVIYVRVYKKGKKVRKKYGALAYIGLACFVGGMMELYKAYLQSVSSIFIVGGVVIMLYLTGQIYITVNLDW